MPWERYGIRVRISHNPVLHLSYLFSHKRGYLSSGFFLFGANSPTGARAAQVVPHVHFHIIPRPATMPQIKNKSWTMFGRGQREELDDDEGAKLAREMRRVLREEVEEMEKLEKVESKMGGSKL